MKSRTGSLRSGLLVLFTALSLILAVTGNLLGNVVAERVPDDWKSRAPMLLALVVLLYLIVNISLARLQDTLADNWRKALNYRLRIARLLLLMLDALLAALGGLLSNLAADKLLPQQFAPYAPLLYAGVVLLALVISFLIYWLQSLPRSAETNRTYFLERLRDRYETLRNDALQGEPSIGVRIAWEADPTISANTSTKPTSEESLSAALPFFDASDGQLLLLGQPGAGKSVLLAELGLDLIRRVRKDASGSIIPVIFPLSTWAINRKPLADWLVESLQGPSNRISEKQARFWVNSGTVLPLLDGLDEVGGIATRDSCAQAINAFYAGHPHVPLVVTSRIQEYREQKVSLTLTEAAVEPLTDDQILAYLEQSGAAYDALHEAVKQNANLREALKTLLFLRVVMRTYSDPDSSQLPLVGDEKAWIQKLFRDYVSQMLKHRVDTTDDALPYPPEKVTLYLSWLAKEMQLHTRTDFYIGNLELTGLPQGTPQRHFRRRVRFASALIGLLFFGSPTGLPVFGAFAVLWGVARIGWWKMPYWFAGGGWLTAGLIGGLAGWLLGGLLYSQGIDWEVGAVGLDSDDGSVWWLLGFPIGMAVGGTVGALAGGTDGSGGIAGAIFGVVGGLVIIVLAFIVLIVFVGIPMTVLSELEDRRLFQKLFHGRNWIFQLIAVVLILIECGVLGRFISSLIADISFIAVSGIIGGVLVAAFVLFFGGSLISEVVFGVLLRQQLRRADLIPPHYVRFLDYAASHILLQKVGSGYRFIHPLLRDYFAGLREGVSAVDSTG